MLQQESELIVADNTGAKRVRIIRVLKSNGMVAELGDIFVATVKDATPNMAVKKSAIVRGVVARMRKRKRRPDGSWIQFDDNACVLIDKQNNPIGSRVFGTEKEHFSVKRSPFCAHLHNSNNSGVSLPRITKKEYFAHDI